MAETPGQPDTVAVDLSGFPSPAAFSGHTWKLFLEPIVGSGERIIAGVVAKLENGDVASQSTLNEKALECVYGKQGKLLVDHTAIQLARVCALLSEGCDQALSASLTGFSFSEPLPGYADSAKELAYSEVLQGASFALHRGKMPTLEDNSEAHDDSDATQVKELVVEQRRSLRQHFKRKFQPFNQDKTITLYYAGPRLIANFSRLSPENAPYYEGQTKIKMMDLAIVRDGDMSRPSGELFKLLLLAPPVAGGRYTKRQVSNYDAAVATFEKLGDAEELHVKKFDTRENVAEYILRHSPS